MRTVVIKSASLVLETSGTSLRGKHILSKVLTIRTSICLHSTMPTLIGLGKRTPIEYSHIANSPKVLPLTSMIGWRRPQNPSLQRASACRSLLSTSFRRRTRTSRTAQQDRPPSSGMLAEVAVSLLEILHTCITPSNMPPRLHQEVVVNGGKSTPLTSPSLRRSPPHML